MDMEEITFTRVREPFGWLGNMSPHPVTYNGKGWRTTEALFQALRFKDEEIQEAIRNETDPMRSVSRAREITKELMKRGGIEKRVVTPQSEEDIQNMELCVRLKIEQYPELREALILTVKTPIYIDVSSSLKGGLQRSLFWGAKRMEDGSWEGENILGKIWMNVREEMIVAIKTPTQKEINAKFGLSVDPYKELKEAYNLGYQVSELSFHNMRWYEKTDDNWTKPVRCYRIEES
jgi:predicted NAD-dependent protein-ADP-ribosyltransferase YbiA (DUF1768 family)